MGKSTFEMAVTLMKWLPLWMVDKILLVLAWLVLGNLERYDIRRPRMGPLELKNKEGKTPVLDIGALGKIRSGDINVVPGIRRFFRGKVEFVDGRSMDVDAVILATGYRSNVSSWLQVGAISFSLSLFLPPFTLLFLFPYLVKVKVLATLGLPDSLSFSLFCTPRKFGSYGSCLARGRSY